MPPSTNTTREAKKSKFYSNENNAFSLLNSPKKTKKKGGKGARGCCLKIKKLK